MLDTTKTGLTGPLLVVRLEPLVTLYLKRAASMFEPVCDSLGGGFDGDRAA
jgi:hypothetical protein